MPLPRRNTGVKKLTAGNSLNRRATKGPLFFEQLEFRRMLDGSTDLARPESAVISQPPVVPGQPVPESLHDCTQQLQQSDHNDPQSVHERQPLPSGVDFNVDGVFDSSDLVSLFQFLQVERLSGTENASSFYTEFDLLVAKHIAPYETNSLNPTDALCLGTQIVEDQLQNKKVQTYEYFHPDSSSLRETVTYAERDEFSFRTAKHYSPDGTIQVSTLDIYRSNFRSIYSRTRTVYAEDGGIQHHSTQVFDNRGRVRRTTETAFYEQDWPLNKSTEVRYFDDSGDVISRWIHYYDHASIKVASESFVYADQIVKRVSTTYGSDGEVLLQQVSNIPTDKPISVNSSAENDLSLMRDAHHTAWHVLNERYSVISNMNRIPAQMTLEGLIEDGDIPQSDAYRYRNLNLYFGMVSEMAEAMSTYNFENFSTRYRHVIDTSTGQWQPWFRDFVQTENLELPLTPLHISNYETLENENALVVAANTARAFEGNAVSHFQSFTESPRIHVNKLLESMRKVKSQIKLLEYQVQNQFPVFDWVVLKDRSTVESMGLQAIRPLTFWVFFEQENGVYDTSDLSEELIRKRVEDTLTDENVFYLINIELWDNDGSLLEVKANMRQLRRAADLIHKYNPNLMLGFYRMLPKRDPNSAYQEADTDRYREWQTTNDVIASVLEDSVDIVYPSLYVFHLGTGDTTTQERWLTYAEQSISEARRVADGKPVLPFLDLAYQVNGWGPDSFPNNLKAQQWIEPDFLTYQLAALERLADGAVIYNTHRHEQNTIHEAGIYDAIQMFQNIKADDRVDEFRQKYSELLVIHHDEIIERLNTEKLISELTRSRMIATDRKDHRMANSLNSEIESLEQELAGMIVLWELIVDF